METYIRTVKYGDVISSLDDENNDNPTFLVQIFLTQNIEDIGIYNDLTGGDRNISIGDNVGDVGNQGIKK